MNFNDLEDLKEHIRNQFVPPVYSCLHFFISSWQYYREIASKSLQEEQEKIETLSDDGIILRYCESSVPLVQLVRRMLKYPDGMAALFAFCESEYSTENIWSPSFILIVTVF